MRLQKLKFLPGNSTRRMGTFEWCQIEKSGISAAQEDIRFTLFDWDTQEVYGIVIDVDKCRLFEGLSLSDTLVDSLGEMLMYQVFTGGGHHVYIPFENGLPWADVQYYKESYLSLLDELELYYDKDWKFDRSPYNKQVYGRVPGALNSKANLAVRHIKTQDYPMAEDIDQILERKAVKIKPHPIAVPSEKDGYNPAKFCGVIDWVRERGEDTPYDVWQMAMGTLAKVNDLATALEINKKKSDAEVESFFNTNKKKSVYLCKGTPARFKGIPDCPCYKCPHHIVLSSPSFVSGTLPTPGAMNGFQRMREMKMGGEPLFVPNPEKIHANSVVNHWVNCNRETHIVEGRSLYKWEGDRWTHLGELVSREGSFPYEVLKELKAIPKHGLQSSAAIKECKQLLCEQTDMPRIDADVSFDDPSYINLKNGVLDMTDLKVYDHDKDFYLRDMVNVSYDEEAECPAWYKFLDETMHESDQLLLQVFMGLAISSIPNSHYQQYLWLKGMPGTGKSKIIEVLTYLLGDKKAMTRKAVVSHQSKDGGVPFDYRGKTLFYIDDFKSSKSTHFLSSWEEFINTITTGLSVPIRRLYNDPEEAVPTCTIIITSNEDPPISSLTSGTIRRVRQIHFYRKVEKVNPYLMEEFKAEMPGILNWILDGIDFYNEHGMPEKGQYENALDEDYRDFIGDEIGAFCAGHVRPGDEEIKATALYNKFLTYRDIDEQDINIYQFGKSILKYLPTILGKHMVNIKRRKNDGVYYNGLTLIGGKNERF